ncbi:hypothetical protein Bpfe_003454 [Biomphalaria pfeifferi]|uniref:Uncharacterized protein n=1 Tax=Biomphalaria pfeifferi TaxID=112525 RepID=A0AAD8FL01_BIOPF|nr:hypothetical protein Bpfe_003454 [Biomphalaria pfeifferi]
MGKKMVTYNLVPRKKVSVVCKLSSMNWRPNPITPLVPEDPVAGSVNRASNGGKCKVHQALRVTRISQGTGKEKKYLGSEYFTEIDTRTILLPNNVTSTHGCCHKDHTTA